MSALQDWSDEELQEHVVRYIRVFRRFPSQDELVRFRKARRQLHLRLPAQGRRAAATLIASF